MLRHTFLRGLPGFALLAAAAPASAQAPSPGQFPGSTPITLVIPYPAGGIGDFLTRLVAKKLGEDLGVSVVVENKPGANGAIAATLDDADAWGVDVAVSGSQKALSATPGIAFVSVSQAAWVASETMLTFASCAADRPAAARSSRAPASR